MSVEAEDSGMSLAERRPRRLNRLLPKRFRDIVPQPLPLLPPVSPALLNDDVMPQVSSPSASNEPRSAECSLGSRVRQIFQTSRNIFGLFRRYFSEQLPTHDPEEHKDLFDLSDEPIIFTSPCFANNGNPFKPFPNKTSFRLADWHWNHGVQKSHESFNRLLDIIGDPEFRPEDVRQTNWPKIDSKLAANIFDGREEEAEWMDEDAGWVRTPITISVPFHHRTKNPGPQDYHVGDLYHRSFVSVIREKLAKPQDDCQFHYEPFELYWQPRNSCAEERVHGELYTSSAFLDAHRELQESSGEPGCNLPRVVVAMMFYSDGTHLTSFGNAKLWPCYLFFGNESKYRRCKPSCHLCNHVAYFQAVGRSLIRASDPL
jgi:Plavaka transposase